MPRSPWPRRHNQSMRAIVFLLALLLISPVLQAPADRWSWPVDSRQVARGFDAPDAPWAAGHRGIDIRVQPDAVIVAPANGTVRFAGHVVDRGVLSLDHGDAVLSSFEPVIALVAEGDTVAAGQPIAVLDGQHTGCGICLHFGVRIDGEYVDPLTMLQLERPVLLPLSGSGVGTSVRIAKAFE